MEQNTVENVTQDSTSCENYLEKLQKEARIRYKQKLELIGKFENLNNNNTT